MPETITITRPRITDLLASEAGKPDIHSINKQIEALGASVSLQLINEILRIYGYCIDTFSLNIGWYLHITSTPIRGLPILDAKTDSKRGVLLLDGFSMQ